MTQSRLIELSYYDPSAQVRLSAYADTVVLDHNSKGGIISAVRFGGYPEMVRAMSDAIYGGATIEATQNSTTRMLQSNVKGYQRQMSHDGVYAVATLMASDDAQTDDRASEGDGEVEGQEAMQPRKCYIFCPQGDRDRLFEELDHKTAAPLIPAFRDYVLDALQKRGDLRQLEVISLKEKMDAWVLDLKPEDRNVVEVLETGLKNGSIQIPGAIPGAPDGFDGVENVTGYLNTFGVTVADRIRHQFMPLFDPANEPLSDEVLAINDCIMNRAGYSLYDAQLAVAEAVKRQLDRKSVALIIAECGAGKTKIGSTALGALHGLWAAQKRSGADKSFGIIMCPSHVTRKWVREIGETLPDTYAMVVHSIAELDRLYAMYEQGDKSVYAVFSKERARDGYMRYPAVKWSKRLRAFLCPDCNEVVTMEISEDGSRYTVPADQFFFQNEHRKNHVCPNCGSVLWSAVNPGKRIEWVKIGEYGWVHRYPNIYKRKEIAMSAEMIKKVENLLKSYREREWKIAVLQHKMKNPVRVTETEVAEAMNYAHGDGQGHTPGRVSNKTLYIALNYKEQAERLNTEAAETIAAELFVLEHEHERLKLYISLIDKREAEVLMLLYSEKESAVNVAERLGYSKRTITRIHNAAVAHLAEMYEYAEKYDG